MKKNRNYKAHAPGAAVVYSGAIVELRRKIAQSSLTLGRSLPPTLRRALDLLESNDLQGAADAVVSAVEAPEHLVPAHSIFFLSLLERTKLLEAMAEERVLEAISPEAAAAAAKCYSISPEILYRLEDRVPPSILQVVVARRCAECIGVYVPASLDRAKRLADERDFAGLLRHYRSMTCLFEGDRKPLEDVFATILIHSTSDASAAGDVDDACEGLELAAKICSSTAAVFTALGSLYRRLGRHESAIDAFKKAVELAPQRSNEQAEALCGLGFAYIDLDEIDLAEAAYRNALQVVPPPLPALEGMIVADTQRQMRARLRQEGRQIEIVAECVACQTRFPVLDFQLRVAALEQMISIDHGPDAMNEGTAVLRAYADCPSCGEGLVLSGLKAGDPALMNAAIRRVDDRQPWEWWLWESELKEPEKTSFQVYRAI